MHHPVDAREVPNPDWLVIPERGLYTGVAIFGAVGSGKTSACMHPFARQLFGWQATNPERRAAGLVLEVKGDFCYDIRKILKEAGREDDYMELSLDGDYQWNPLAAHWLDSYSLAYTVSSLLNQLFGKGKDPFWQQAYTNLVKWIIELHRIFPDRWVTLQDVYRCAINPELFKQKIGEAAVVVESQKHGAIVVSADEWARRKTELLAPAGWAEHSDGECKTLWTAAVERGLKTQGVKYRVITPGGHTYAESLDARLDSVVTWYNHDWMQLDPKLRTSCVEGISSFLSLFDMEDVAAIFCPKAPPAPPVAGSSNETENADKRPPVSSASMRKHLPPLDELIETGTVLALNMPAGSNPALARAVGVFLKNAWLQTLLRRPARMKADPKLYFRPLSSFAMNISRSSRSARMTPPATRRPLPSPGSAVSSPSSPPSPSLRSAPCWAIPRPGALSCRPCAPGSFFPSATTPAPRWPRSSAARFERSSRAGPSTNPRGKPKCRSCPARPGAAGVRSEPASHSRNTGRLCLIRESLACFPIARRFACPMTAPTPQAPSAFISSRTTFRSTRPTGGRSMRGRYERHRRHGLPAPALDEAALDRAAIQIARPLGLDPATAPILDARLDDGSRVAICVPPAAPHVAITIRRFGKRSYSPEDLVRSGSLPIEVLDAARTALLGRRNILVSGGTDSGKTTLLNALVELLPTADRIVSIEDTLELRIDRKNCVRFEARGIDSKSVTIRDLVRHALRHRPDHIVVGAVRGGEAADLLQALNTGHGGSLTTIHANNAESALSRLATCAMQGETDLPWEVT